MIFRSARGAVLLSLVLVVAACGAGAGDDPEPVFVSAAASLTDAFTDMESAFESVNPDVDVVLNIASSSALREQITGGAPVDVFASAGAPIMDQLVASGEVTATPTVFALNTVQIAVPLGNPAAITGPQDLANDDLFIGLCAEGVPCGDLARRALGIAGVVPSVDTNEPDVRSLLTKLESAELDAGVVYVTDVAASSAVEAVEWPGGSGVATVYPIAPVDGAPNAPGAIRFIEFVLSGAGRDIMTAHGFDLP